MSLSTTRGQLLFAATAMVLAAVVAVGIVLAMRDDGGGESDEQQARATVERLYAAIADGDAAKVCAQLNEKAQRQLEQGGLGGKSGSCVDSFQQFLDEAEKAGGLNLTLKAKVKSVKVSGDTAVAKVSFGGGGRNGDIPLEKVDGEWKLEAAGATPSQ
jgi:hypothetical protein